MISLLYLIIGAIIGFREVNVSRKEGLKDQSGLIIIFLVFLFLWLPLYSFQWYQNNIKKKD